MSLYFSSTEILPYEDSLSAETTDAYMEKVFSVLKKHIHAVHDRSSKVIDFKTPDELQKLFNFGLERKGKDLDSLVEMCAEVLAYSVKTGMLFNML